MDDRLSRLESSVRDLDRRLRALEQAGAATAVLDEDARPARDVASISRDRSVELLSLVGRTFVALGGAYLLRALTDSATVLMTAGGRPADPGAVATVRTTVLAGSALALG